MADEMGGNPEEPNPNQAIAFKDLITKIIVSGVPTGSGVLAEVIDDEYGLTLEDVFYDTRGVAQVIYTDYKLAFDGLFTKHVGFETFDEKMEREKLYGETAPKALSRHISLFEDDPIEFQRVNSNELEEAMSRARRIIEELE